VLNLSDILQGYDPLASDILNFVQVTKHGRNVEIQVNTDGDQGGEFTTVAVIECFKGDVSVDDLMANGNLVV
jgi:hypothetical protein